MSPVQVDSRHRDWVHSARRQVDAADTRAGSTATGAGLDVLVEVHDETELKRALDVGAALIGINNRDLRTFRVSLQTSIDLIAKAHALAPSNTKIFVAESGIHTRQDVQKLAKAGAQAVLVGESIMREKDIAAKVHQLLGT